MAGTQKLKIINAALAKVGNLPIANLNEVSPAATYALTLYDNILEEFLSNYPWRFALKEEVLAQISSPTLTSTDIWSYAHNLPSDCLKPIGLIDRSIYEIHGRELYTNTEDPRLLFVREITEGYFPPYFTAALTQQLAADLCIPITENTTAANFLENKAQLKWKIARASDSQTTSAKSLSSNIQSLINSGVSARV